MSLSMLVGGADCGPSNALQGLSKQFDRDRGLQQVCHCSCVQSLRAASIDVLTTGPFWIY